MFGRVISAWGLPRCLYRSKYKYETICYIYMAGVQNSRSQGLYAVRRVGIENLILHFGYEAGRN